jgi:hypothetical protein
MWSTEKILALERGLRLEAERLEQAVEAARATCAPPILDRPRTDMAVAPGSMRTSRPTAR